MADDLAFKVGVHACELAAFLLGDSLDGNARHHGHDIPDVVLGDRDAVVLGIFFPSAFGFLELLIQDALLVAQTRGLFVALGANHTALLVLDVLDLFLNLDDFFGNIDVGQVHAAAHLVQGIDGLVRKVTVGDVAACECHTCLKGLIGVLDTVVLLVLVLDVVEDLNRLFNGGGFHHDFLEATFQRSILFNVLAVFVQRRGTNALDFATRKGWLEHVGRVQRPAGTPCTYNGVDFVDEEDDIRRLLQLVHHGLHALFELPAVFGPGHQRSHVQGDNALVEQHTADLLLHDAEGQPFCNGALAHTGLTHQDGVVLFAAAQNLADAFNLFGTSHDGVQSTFFSHAGEVTSKVVKHRRLGLGVALPRSGTSRPSRATEITSALGGGVVVRQGMVSARCACTSVL